MLSRPGFLLLCASSLALSLAVFAHALLVPLYGAAVGLPESALGVIVGALSLALVVGRLACGWAVDRWGGRGFLLAGALSWALSAPLMGLATSPGSLLALRALQGLGLAFFTNGVLGILAHGVADARRGSVLSIWWFVFGVGAVVGPLAGGAAARATGYGAAFGLTGAMALLAAALALPASRTRPVPSAAPSLRRVRLLAGGSLVPGLVGLAVGVAAGACFTFLPLHAYAIGAARPGVVFAAYGIGMLPAQLLCGPVSDRAGRGAAILPALGLGAVFLPLLALARDVAPLTAVAFLCGFTISGISPVLTAWAVDRAPAHERGNAAGLSIAYRELGNFAGAAGIGLALELGRALPALLGMSLVLLASVALVLPESRRAAVATAPQAARPVP